MQDPDFLRFAPPELRILVQVDRRTWRRWLTGRHRIPTAVLALARIFTAGELPQGGKLWEGWRFHDGALFDPEGTAHTPGSIQVWAITRQQLQALRARENVTEPESLPAGVRPFPRRRLAHQLTAALYQKLEK